MAPEAKPNLQTDAAGARYGETPSESAQQKLAKALKAIDAYPGLSDAWITAADILIHHKRWQEASDLLACAVGVIPSDASLLAQQAFCLSQCGKLAAGFAAAEQALRLQPNHARALLARIEILSEAGYYDLALQDSAALQDKGAPGGAAFTMGSLAFITGEMDRGMRLLAVATDRGWAAKALPPWDGRHTKHLVIYGTQAFGDRLQFARYINSIRPRADKLTLYVPRALTRLMRTSFPEAALAIGAEEADQFLIPMPDNVAIGLPDDDDAVYCTFSELPFFANDRFSPQAESVPYIKADDTLRAAWRERLANVPKPRIGLVWAPGTWYSSDPQRTVAFEGLQPLIDLAGPHFVSLQLGNEAKRATGLFDASPYIDDFADSAALLRELDLIICFDSGPAHLAGALGRPVWMLLPFNADWRWLIGREDSVWYPSMRLFRAERPRDWSAAIAKIGGALQQFLSGDENMLKPVSWTQPLLRRHPHAVPLAELAETNVLM